MKSDLVVPECSPGQQPSLRWLLAWLEAHVSAQPGEVRRMRRSNQEVHRPVAVSPDPTAWIERATHDGMRVLGPQQVQWRTCDGDVVQPDSGSDRLLGHAALWTCLGDAVQWCDLAVIGWFAGGPQVLPVQTTAWVDGGEARLALTISQRDGEALAAAGLSPARLSRALGGADQSLWLLRLDGTGAFLSIGLDLSIETSLD